MMEELRVGNKYEYLMGQDGATFQMADNGATLTIRLSRPDKKEKENLLNGKIRYSIAYLDDIIWLFWKFGSLNYIETPFSIAQAKNLTEVQEVEEGQGFAVNVLFVDGLNGELFGMKLISLNTRVSEKLIELISKQPYLSEVELTEKAMNTQMKYSTDDLQRFSLANGRI